MSEFTGERVIPGEVDIDLLNEHVARYAFAARLARGKRVLDAGCGAGYGAARLTACARQVVAIDIAPEAVEGACRQYGFARLQFLRGDCRDLPFQSGSFDLVVAFEVIEHLQEWERLLAEARRVLAPCGEMIISTPNRLYYSESRPGPNPFHVHEFDYEEFCSQLRRYFPHFQVFLQNHAEGVVFSPPELTGAATTVESGAGDPATSHFFVAVCSGRPLHGSPAFVYIPQSGNVLRERERHIALLEGELEQKNRWLEETKESLAALDREHREFRQRAQEIVDALEQENARKTEWGRQLETELERLKGLIETLQAELAERTAWALQLDAERSELAANYERLNQEAEKVRADLTACVDQLHQTEAELEERTRWALGLDQRVKDLDIQVQQLTNDLNSLFGSLAYRIGKRVGLAPIPPSDPRGRRNP